MNYREPPPDAPLLVFSTQIIALDRTNGQALWTYDTGRAPVRRFAIDGDRLFVFDGNGVVHCLMTMTGQSLGRIELNVKVPNNMLADQGRLYVSFDDAVFCLDYNGRILWEKKIAVNGSFSLCGLAVPGGNVAQPDYSTG